MLNRVLTKVVGASIITAVLGVHVSSAVAGYSDAVLADNPLAYFRLNETAGSLVNSEVGGHGGSVIGTVGLADAGPQVAAFDGFDAANTGATFVGADGNGIDLGAGISTAMVGASAITTEMWISKAALSTGIYQDNAASVLYTDAAAGANIVIRGNNLKVGGRSTSSDGFKSIAYGVNTSVSVPGDWYHIVGILDFANNDILLYVNGVLVQSNTSAGFSQSTYASGSYSTWTDRIGNVAGSGGLPDNVITGAIDEVAYYNRALTAEEVSAHYDAAFVPEPVSSMLLGIGSLCYLSARWRSTH